LEDVELIVIPTVSKAKISHNLSYPVGAETISKSLQDIPQISLLRLHLYFWSDNHLRRGKYEFLRVEYLSGVTPPEHYPVTPLYKRALQYQWEIVVQAVPRVHRHQIKTYIVDSALAEVKKWLAQRGDLVQNGSDILAFFHDEKLDKFETYRVSHLKPVR